MKLVKSLLLGSAAGLVAVAGASAADLGVKKPTAVEYVKTCPQYGAGFFVVPGTTSCLRILGRVRVDYLFNNSGASTGLAGRNFDHNTFRARGYLQADHRTASEYGLVRTFIRLWINRDNAAAHAPNVELAFIQFGGLTVGRATSIAEHGYSFNLAGSNAVGGFSDIFAVNQAAYTFAFGGGFSASVALENNPERRVGAVAVGGAAMPDLIGSLDYSASWGSVKVAAAAHQLRHATAAVSSKFGYAILGAAKFNLPFGAAGSNLWVNGTYYNGASSYAGYGNATTVIGAVAFTPSDAILSGTTLQLTKGYSFSAGLQAFFSPTVYAGISGYYGVMDPFGANNTIRTTTLIGTVGWVPVAGLQFVGEVVYRSIGANTIVAGTQKNDVSGRIRVQRDF